MVQRGFANIFPAQLPPVLGKIPCVREPPPPLNLAAVDAGVDDLADFADLVCLGLVEGMLEALAVDLQGADLVVPAGSDPITGREFFLY